MRTQTRERERNNKPALDTLTLRANSSRGRETSEVGEAREDAQRRFKETESEKKKVNKRKIKKEEERKDVRKLQCDLQPAPFFARRGNTAKARAFNSGITGALECDLPLKSFPHSCRICKLKTKKNTRRKMNEGNAAHAIAPYILIQQLPHIWFI